MKTNYKNIDEYIGTFSPEIQKLLAEVRVVIQNAAPEAKETISYGMPTFIYKGILVHFAAFKNHLGFYALPSGNKAFKEELAAYKTGKGSIQFPLHEAIPFELISKIVKFRLDENIEKESIKKTKKKK